MADPKIRIPSGVDLARKLNEGIIHRAPTKYIQDVRSCVTESYEELLDVGARIRPLKADGVQIGWIRGVHDTERRLLQKWVPDLSEFVFRCLLLATSLGPDEIGSLGSLEVRRLAELVMAMGDRDASLYPYLSAFSTTRASESLWFGGGNHASFFNRMVSMPDGKQITIMCPSDHAKLWVTLCTYREQSKKRLDDSWNAVLIVRPWVGKSIDGLSAELKAASRMLRADAPEPWEHIVQAPVDRSLDDGWAHLENMETKEGMLKELHGMLSNDRHERLMARFESQQVEAAEKQKREIERMVARRGGPGISQETIRVETEEDVRRKEMELRKGKVAPIPVRREQPEERTLTDLGNKLKKYQ